MGRMGAPVCTSASATKAGPSHKKLLHVSEHNAVVLQPIPP